MSKIQPQNSHPFSNLSNYPIKQVLRKLVPFYKIVSTYIFMLFILTLLGTIASTVLPLSSKILIDYVIGQSPASSINTMLSKYGILIDLSWLKYLFKTINGFIVLFSSITIINLIISVARQICVFNLRQRLTAQVTHTLFTTITNFNLMLLKKFPSGYLTSRIFQDSNSVEQLVSHVIPSIMTQILKFIFGCYILYQLNSKMTLICLAVAPFYILLNFIFHKPIKKLNEEVVEQRSMNTSFVQKNLEGIETIKVFNIADKVVTELNDLLQTLIGSRFKLLSLSLVANYLVKAINFTCFLTLLYIGVNEIKSGEMTLGDYVAFMSYMGYLQSPVRGLSMLYLTVQPMLTALRRIYQILDTMGVDIHSGKDISNVQEINFDNVCFAYESNKEVLTNFTQKFTPGNIYLIPWASGSGKTTIARLLMGFISPTNGQIIINSKSMKELSLVSVRDSISYVSQETFIFNDSIRNNLLIANPEASEALMDGCLDLAQANRFIEELPEGIDTLLTDRGNNLSAGQRQRLAIARALMKPSNVLLLDEPFANIDKDTLQIIVKNVREHAIDKIVVIFSHQNLLDNGDVVVITDTYTE